MSLRLEGVHRVGIVDDVKADAEALGRLFEDFDMQALIMPRPRPRATAEEYLSSLPLWTCSSATTSCATVGRSHSRERSLPPAPTAALTSSRPSS